MKTLPPSFFFEYIYNEKALELAMKLFFHHRSLILLPFLLLVFNLLASEAEVITLSEETLNDKVATVSQFFISLIQFTHALTFATIMTTRQLVSILLSCVWFAHPLSWEQCIGAIIVFGSLYAKSFLRSKPQKPSPAENLESGESIPLKGNP